ncbi:hypothetical protein HHK36_013694 [Tetracentron sinense]|uniref:Receptor ligand binding region domain-containing protein n=1 Tax=Tetracentron sinense TaxID=13715 RepID=A0A835DEN7_TETSI|nr:hypothetical protein HHK36_013694 [Tetracentron sinense]
MEDRKEEDKGGEPSVEEALGSSLTMEKVAAAKQFIESHYRAQMKNMQERMESLWAESATGRNGSVESKVRVPVGVVIDLNSTVGKIANISISMALSDFYAAHAYSKTRMVPYTRDSKQDVVGAASAASLGSLFFALAKEEGMMTKGYAWIITDGLSSMLDLMTPSTIDSMQGVLGQLESSGFQVFNVIGKGERVIGYCTPKKGLSRELDVVEKADDGSSTGTYDNLVTKFIFRGVDDSAD